MLDVIFAFFALGGVSPSRLSSSNARSGSDCSSSESAFARFFGTVDLAFAGAFVVVAFLVAAFGAAAFLGAALAFVTFCCSLADASPNFDSF